MRLRIREEHRAMPAYEKPPAWRVDVYCIVKPRVRRVVQLNYIAETILKRKLLRDIMELRSANCNKKVRRSVHSKWD